VPLRDKVVLRTVGYILSGLAILTFAAYVVSKVLAGESAETYHSGTMVRWSYGAALATFVALAFAAAVAGIVRFASWFRIRREITRLAKARDSAGPNQGGGGSASPDTSLERTREG
jgi:hypothetical protein